MSKKKLMILISGLLVLGVIGGGGYFVLQKQNTEEGKDAALATDEEGAEAKQAEAERLEKRANFPLESFIVNLADPGGKRYLSTRIVLEFSDKKRVEALQNKLPQIRDRVLMILPTKTYKELKSVEGKDALKNTLIEDLNGLLQKGEITNVYFQEFVIQ